MLKNTPEKIENPEIVRRNMVRLRKLHGHSLTNWARILDVSYSYIYQIETGRKSPSSAFIVKFCNRLEVRSFALYREE